jgi:DTW domain-containing protein YfiP
MEELNIEANLLETDIAEKSYNVAKSSGSKILKKNTNTSRLVLRIGENDPLDQLQIAPVEILDECQQRCECSGCHKSRMYFCYTCHIPLPCSRNAIPRLKLPFNIDIVKHPGEVDGKSTAIHAKVIAPDQVVMYTYPKVPKFDKTDEENVFLIFPGKNAVTTEEAFESFVGNSTNKNFRAVFIDSTWSQAKKVLRDPVIAKLPKICLSERQTLFWRSQTGQSDTSLATIEAIYHFVVDYHVKKLKLEYHGEYDNLLFLFKFFHTKIHNLHQGR